MRVSTADLEQCLRLVGDWHDAGSVDELALLATTGLRQVVPADGVGWNEIDVHGREIRIVVDPPDYFEASLEPLARLLHQHPIITHTTATGDGRAVAFSDFLAVREYHRLELYADFFGPLGVEDQLAFALRTDGPLVGVAFNRASRSFGERDRGMLNLLRPHLLAAYRHLEARDDARRRIAALDRGLEEAGYAVAAVRDGAAEPFSLHGLRLLSDWFGAGDPPLPAPGGRIVLERPDARLELRLVDGDPPLLLLDEAKLVPTDARIRELGLTRREAETLQLVARGLENAAIARELGVSVRTVQKHLENAFRTLGVRDRRTAAALLLGR